MDSLRNIVDQKLSNRSEKFPFIDFEFENEIVIRFDCPKVKDRISNNFVSIMSAKKIKPLISSIDEIYQRCEQTLHIDTVELLIEDCSFLLETYPDLPFNNEDNEYNKKVLIAKSKLYCEPQYYNEMLTEIIRRHLIVQDSIHSILNSN